MSPKNFIIAIALALALVAGVFVALRIQAPVNPEFALVLPDPNPVPEFTLVDQDGEAIDQSVFRGQWDLVFFGFTHCPDICPATMQILMQVKMKLAEQNQDPMPRVVLVSVDPERDTPEIMSKYVSAFGDGNLGITGDLSEVSKVAAALGIYFAKAQAENGNYSVDHSTVVLVINPDGRFQALFSAPHRVEDFVHDLPLIMATQ